MKKILYSCVVFQFICLIAVIIFLTLKIKNVIDINLSLAYMPMDIAVLAGLITIGIVINNDKKEIDHLIDKENK